MLGSIDSIVAILIIAAALLAFVVLYNLSNINISERKREIATLKVLGFYHNEVDRYITRENFINYYWNCYRFIVWVIFKSFHYIYL